MDRRLLLASGAYIDLSEYLLKSEAETLYAPLDAILNKQDKLISGTNIKTINGNSLLGGGDITISGGGDYLPLDGGTINGDLVVMGTIASSSTIVASGGISGRLVSSDYELRIEGSESPRIVWGNILEDREYQIISDGDGTKFLSNDGEYKTISSGSSSSGAYPEVSHGTSDTTLTLTPNIFHVWDEVSALTLTLGSETSGVANEFLFQFTSGSTATTLSLPNDIKLANELAIGPNMIYQVSILKGLASVLEFKNSPLEIEFYVNGSHFNALSNMTWEEFINSDYNPDIYNDKMFITGNYGNPKYAGSVYSDDDIEYFTIYTEGYGEVLLTDKILSTNYIIS